MINSMALTNAAQVTGVAKNAYASEPVKEEKYNDTNLFESSNSEIETNKPEEKMKI